jgi:hypothetical protein
LEQITKIKFEFSLETLSAPRIFPNGARNAVSFKLILIRSEVKPMSAGHLRSAQPLGLSGYMVLWRLPSLSDRLATFEIFQRKRPPRSVRDKNRLGRLQPTEHNGTLTLDDKSLMSRSNSWRRSATGRRRCHIRHWNPPRFL